MKLTFIFILSCMSLFTYCQTGIASGKWGNPGYYTVTASDSQKVYFYTTPDTSTRRKAFFNKPDWVFIQKIKNGFGYTYFINSNEAKSVGWLPMKYLSIDTSVITQKVGTNIIGAFKQKGILVYAYAVQTKIAKGNRGDVNETPEDYTVFFSDSTIKPVDIGCCDPTIINEGDLNDNGNDELSVFLAPEGGCTYDMITYSFENGSWKIIVPYFLVPTFCDPFSADNIQKQVFKLKDGIYYYNYNNNLQPIKTKVILK
jgi:hypothetical protein